MSSSIGGKKFSTTVETLTLREPDSMLATMFSGRHDVNGQKSEKGYIFIDRGGKHFRHILNWLRDGAVPIMEYRDYMELLREAEYFQLGGFIGEIKAKTEALHEENRAKSVGSDLTRADIIKCAQSSHHKVCLRLHGVNLPGIDLSGLDLSDATFANTNLKFANLTGANLGGVILIGANLSSAKLGTANMGKANLNQANLSGANLSCANLEEANLSQTKMSSANLKSANLEGVTLMSNSQLRNKNLVGANIHFSEFTEGMNLTKANLQGGNYNMHTILWNTSAPVCFQI